MVVPWSILSTPDFPVRISAYAATSPLLDLHHVAVVVKSFSRTLVTIRQMKPAKYNRKYKFPSTTLWIPGGDGRSAVQLVAGNDAISAIWEKSGPAIDTDRSESFDHHAHNDSGFRHTSNNASYSCTVSLEDTDHQVSIKDAIKGPTHLHPVGIIRHLTDIRNLCLMSFLTLSHFRYA